MNCTDINKYIDDLLDNQLDQADQGILDEHVSGCVSCADKLDQAKRLQAALYGLPLEEPSDTFEKRVFAEVRRQHQVKQENRFAAGFVTAIAASLMVWLVAGVFFNNAPVPGPETISVAFNETQTVRLMIESQKEIQQVTLNLDLPDNVQLDWYAGQKQLTWKTSLKQGANVLALPVMAVDHGQGELIAQLKYGDTMKTFRVVLKTTRDGVQSYLLD